MKIGIIGTGTVGQTLAARLSEVGHQVVIGTRNVHEKLADENVDQYGNPPFRAWQKSHPEVPLVTFEEAAKHGEIVINATKGGASLEALQMAGSENLSNKILMDVGNPLDGSTGFPPSLLPGLSNSNSLGEKIQMTFPETKVVKTLNTMAAGLMVNPLMINNGDHTNFICGNDNNAKQKVRELLVDMGWKDQNILDLGDISASRGAESFLPTWLRIMNAKKTPFFNLRIVD
ncbi:MAG TPA: NAD(P)-binding domain-containing protein [Lentimicrobium sp.]|nr:NAD(P)-binding domain-containing protein [Lentimicrobium sp.]